MAVGAAERRGRRSRFALVATTGKSRLARKRAVPVCAGSRTPVQPSRAAPASPGGTPGSTSVSGPGQ